MTTSATLKILTLVAFLFVNVHGDHIGGPLGVIITLGLMSGSILATLGALLPILAIGYLLATAFQPEHKSKIVTVICLLILFTPLALQAGPQLLYYPLRDEVWFLIPSLIFLSGAVFWIWTMFRRNTPA